MAVSRPKPGRLPESALAIQIDTTQFHLGTRVSHGLPRFFHSFNRTVVGAMSKLNRFSPEVRERAVRLVQEHRGEYILVGSH
jgi:hypothetical protein